MYIVPRETVDDIRNLTYDELVEYARAKGILESFDESEWVCIHGLLGGNEFHGFGKYYENAENIEKLGEPLFTNSDTQKHFEDYCPYVVGKEAVLCAIEDYRKKIVNWYSGLLMTQEEYDSSCLPWKKGKTTQEERIKQHLESQKREWEIIWGMFAVNTDEESTNIVRSWLYEYEIFEIAHQFKMMDWEKNTIVFYGW
jgi:hypothetical protein